MITKLGGVVALLVLLASCNTMDNAAQNSLNMSDSSTWKKEVEKNLQLFGHRNWIVVADAAYPQQSHPAIRTIYAEADQLEVVTYVNTLIEKSDHVTAQIKLDKELEYVSEEAAGGIGAYRTGLERLLAGKPIQKSLHEDIIRELDSSARLFNVLVIKTPLAIPYTSVFFQLECGYWDAESEEALRKKLGTTHE